MSVGSGRRRNLVLWHKLAPKKAQICLHFPGGSWADFSCAIVWGDFGQNRWRSKYFQVHLVTSWSLSVSLYLNYEFSIDSSIMIGSICLKSWASCSYFLNSTGLSIRSSQISPFVALCILQWISWESTQASHPSAALKISSCKKPFCLFFHAFIAWKQVS